MQIPVWMLILISTLSWGLWGVCDKMALRGMRPLHVQLINAVTMSLIIPVYYLLACSVNRPFVWESKYFLWSIAGAIATSFASVTYIFALNQKDATYVVGLTAGYPAGKYSVNRFLFTHFLDIKKIKSSSPHFLRDTPRYL